VPVLVPRLSAPVRVLEKPRGILSKDAELLRLVRDKLRGQGSIFAALHNHAGWDRDRYAAAVEELQAAENGQVAAAALCFSEGAPAVKSLLLSSYRRPLRLSPPHLLLGGERRRGRG